VRPVWPVLVAGTCGVLAGHWLIMAGMLLDEGGTAGGAVRALIAIGLGVLAVTIVAVAVATGRGPALGVIAAATGAVVLAAAWALRGDEVPLPAITAGVGMGAVLAVRRLRVHLLWVRLMMLGVIVGYVIWVMNFAAAFAIVIAPFLPFPTVGVADYASEREARRHSAPGYAGLP
jgi:hypothetical protein